MTKQVYLIQKISSFFHIFLATVKSNLFLCLFFVVYILITVYHSNLFVNFIPKPVDTHFRLIYEANFSNYNFNNFNKFLTSGDLDFEFNVNVGSCMNTIFHVVDFCSLALFTRLNFFKPKHLTDPSFLYLFFFLNVLLCIFKEWTRKEVDIPFNWFCFYTFIP